MYIYTCTHAHITDYHIENAKATPTQVPAVLMNANPIASLMQALIAHIKAIPAADLTQADAQVISAYPFLLLFVLLSKVKHINANQCY